MISTLYLGHLKKYTLMLACGVFGPTIKAMGKIFTPETISAEGLPEKGVQIETGRSLMTALANLSGLHAAIIYGSTGLDQPNRRSDVDVAVVHEEGYDRSVFYHDLLDIIGQVPRGSLVEVHTNSSRDFH